MAPHRPHRIDCLPSILGFLERIGLAVRQAPVGADPFLPGIRIDRGTLVVEPDALAAAGDLLHEAGHLACAPAGVRPRLDGDVKASLDGLRAGAPAGPIGDQPADQRPLTALLQGDEPMAIAWSAAALLNLQLPVDCVFYPGSYGTPAGTVPVALLQQLEGGLHPGIAWLALAGMTGLPPRFQGDPVPPVAWPRMHRWLQD